MLCGRVLWRFDQRLNGTGGNRLHGVRERKLDRKHVLQNATIISPDGSQLARIRNLSPSGAQISCSRPPGAGCDVIFKRGSAFIAARVAWAEKGSAGLEFYRQIEPGELGSK